MVTSDFVVTSLATLSPVALLTPGDSSGVLFLLTSDIVVLEPA